MSSKIVHFGSLLASAMEPKRPPKSHWKIMENLMLFWVPKSPPRASKIRLKMGPEILTKIDEIFGVFFIDFGSPLGHPNTQIRDPKNDVILGARFGPQNEPKWSSKWASKWS